MLKKPSDNSSRGLVRKASARRSFCLRSVFVTCYRRTISLEFALFFALYPVKMQSSRL